MTIPRPVCHFERELSPEPIEFRPWEPLRFCSAPPREPNRPEADVPVARRTNVVVEIILFVVLLVQTGVWMVLNQLNQ